MATDYGNESRWKRWLKKLRSKYRLVIMNDQTFEEKLSIRLSRMNVFVISGSVAILLVFLTTYIIAFTPLREYIPGYMDVGLQSELYALHLRADSIQNELDDRDLYILNLRRIMEGEEILTQMPDIPDTMPSYDDITLSSSVEDSLLRAEYAGAMDQYSQRYLEGGDGFKPGASGGIASMMFFTPLKGIITNEFNPRMRHYGVDIVSPPNESVKAVLDGRVILANWTLETGHVIGIIHSGNLVSFYKHNAALLKQQGSYVRAGDPIAIVGNSGELTTGPHLHFELWYNGMPVNPVDYISF